MEARRQSIRLWRRREVNIRPRMSTIEESSEEGCVGPSTQTQLVQGMLCATVSPLTLPLQGASEQLTCATLTPQSNRQTNYPPSTTSYHGTIDSVYGDSSGFDRPPFSVPTGDFTFCPPDMTAPFLHFGTTSGTTTDSTTIEDDPYNYMEAQYEIITEPTAVPEQNPALGSRLQMPKTHAIEIESPCKKGIYLHETALIAIESRHNFINGSAVHRLGMFEANMVYPVPPFANVSSICPAGNITAEKFIMGISLQSISLDIPRVSDIDFIVLPFNYPYADVILGERALEVVGTKWPHHISPLRDKSWGIENWLSAPSTPEDASQGSESTGRLNTPGKCHTSAIRTKYDRC